MICFRLWNPTGRSLGEESSHVDGKLSGCLVILGVATIMMLRVWVIIQGPKICSVNRAITACVYSAAFFADNIKFFHLIGACFAIAGRWFYNLDFKRMQYMFHWCFSFIRNMQWIPICQIKVLCKIFYSSQIIIE